MGSTFQIPARPDSIVSLAYWIPFTQPSAFIRYTGKPATPTLSSRSSLSQVSDPEFWQCRKFGLQHVVSQPTLSDEVVVFSDLHLRAMNARTVWSCVFTCLYLQYVHYRFRSTSMYAAPTSVSYFILTGDRRRGSSIIWSNCMSVALDFLFAICPDAA